MGEFGFFCLGVFVGYLFGFALGVITMTVRLA